ncbi:anoctamin-like protein isoform X1 [Iris pallida]|uniref:Anoctamin-like protein isoform X1 n=1 Tax=Iris pallida TaxID=29817 RepID=A0AAX6FIS4_IRIPA|nr:anoctamin-like protein isoform X1 [Iris pallida]
MGIDVNGGGGGGGEEATGFEVAIVVPKKKDGDADGGSRDCVELLVRELERAGLVVDRVQGISDEFIKLAAPMRTLGRAAAELHLKKLTYVGVDLPFEWDQVTAFVRQPDGSLFSWCERFTCFRHLIYEIVNETKTELTLYFAGKEFKFQPNESLIKRMESEGIVKQIFPMHDEIRRKQLLGSWALNWLDLTWQPIDEIYSYFGTKIATYFVFLGMYTRWLLFPAAFGIALHMIDFGSLQLLVLPAFFIFIVSWAVFFSQFWKRKNAALLARWGIDNEINSTQSHWEPDKKVEADNPKEKRSLQRDEWLGLLLRIRNNAIIVVAIIVCSCRLNWLMLICTRLLNLMF